MNNEEKAEVYKAIINLGDLFNRPLNRTICEIYVENLSDLPYLRVMDAIKSTVRTGKFFPTIADLREIVSPLEESKDHANEMAGQILECIQQFGRYRAAEVKEYLDPLCWFAVERFGGWETVCNTEYDQMTSVRAQLRDMCSMALTVKSRNPDNSKMLQFQKRSMQSLGSLFKETLPQIENN